MGAFEHEFHQFSAQRYAGSQFQHSQRQYVYGLGVEPEQQGSDKCAVHCLDIEFTANIRHFRGCVKKDGGKKAKDGDGAGSLLYLDKSIVIVEYYDFRYFPLIINNLKRGDRLFCLLWARYFRSFVRIIGDKCFLSG